jgi:hypothetical protein
VPAAHVRLITFLRTACHPVSAQLDLAIFRRTVSSLWFMRHFANIPVRLSAFAFRAQVRPSQP